MSNITVSLNKGKPTVSVKFSAICDESEQLSYDSLKAIAEANPKAGNARILFDAGETWDRVESFTCALDRADKTLGTYVTRINKIVRGIDPGTRERRSDSPKARSRGELAVELVDNKARIFSLIDESKYAVVGLDGTVETSDWHLLSRYIEAVFAVRFRGRLGELREYADGVEVAPSRWVIQHAGETVTVDTGKESGIDEARAALAQRLALAGRWQDIEGIATAEVVELGGGKAWLTEWLNSQPTVTHSLPQQEE